MNGGMRMRSVVLVLALVTSVVEGFVGDDRSKFLLERVGEFPCEVANFGKSIPNDGIQGRAAWINGCEYYRPTNAEILILDVSSKEEPFTLACDPFQAVMDISLRFIAHNIKAIVVVNWQQNGTFSLHADAWNQDQGTQLRPTCMISKADGDRIFQTIERKAWSASLHNGDTEEIFWQASNAEIREVYVDGKAVSKSGEVVIDNYQVIAVKVRKTGPNSPTFKLGVTDHFGTSSRAWKCTKDTPPKDWKSSEYRPEFDSSTTWLQLYELIPRDPEESDKLDFGHWIGVSEELGEAKIDLHCFGERRLGSVRKFGFEYWLTEKSLPYEQASSSCRAKGGFLASIHSKREHMLVESLLPQNKDPNVSPNAFIGLDSLTEKNSFLWNDGTTVDFFMWGPNNPVDDASKRCVAVVLEKMDTFVEGKWYSKRCDDARYGVCKKFVGGSDDEVNSSDDERCFMFLGESGGHWSIGQLPAVLNATEAKMCVFHSNPKSCCTSQFINDIIFPNHQRAVSQLRTPSCRRIAEQLNCMPCMSSQGRYVEMNIRKNLFANICEDTCITLYDSCKDEPNFPKGLGPVELCKEFAKTSSQEMLGSFSIQVKPVDADDCFRVDGMPPTIRNATISLEGVVRGLVIQFNEPIKLFSGTVQLREPGTKNPALSVGLTNSNVNLFKTNWTSDTIALPLPEDKCFTKGTTYDVFVPSLAVVDYAGNAFPGTGSALSKLQVTVSHDINCGHHHRKTSRSGLGVFIAVLIALGGFVGFAVWRKRTGGAGFSSGTAGRMIDATGEAVLSFMSAVGTSVSGWVSSGSRASNSSFAPNLDRMDLDDEDASRYVPLDTSRDVQMENTQRTEHGEDEGEQEDTSYEPPSDNLSRAALMQV